MSIIEAKKAKELAEQNKAVFNRSQAMTQFRAVVGGEIRRALTFGFTHVSVSKLGEIALYPADMWFDIEKELKTLGYSVSNTEHSLAIAWNNAK